MEIRKLVGANMRRHRLAAELSQEAVAERMGVDRAHVSSMERGQQNVTLETLASAAEALGIRPSAFFDEGAAPPPAGIKAPRTRRVISPRG
jgi:transcriptional regulator with XRE-family HTH domain